MTKKGVLLINLGTPNSYKTKDVYKYLIEFLTDKRVIDLPFIQRHLLVRSIIVPFRYRNSAKCYKKIWTHQGSPLLVYGEKVEKLLQQELGDNYVVKLAMRYQNPSIESALDSFEKNFVKEYIIIPLFPQYSSSCQGSIFEKVFKLLSQYQLIPNLKLISHFYDHPDFISSYVAIAKDYDLQNYDHVLFSFHGLPHKHLTKADKNNFCLKEKNCCKIFCKKNEHCYSAQCYKTASLIASRLNLKKENFTVSFQSRLGKDPWLTPMTSTCMQLLPQKGVKKLLIFCPSFICDCLETLYEIEIECEELFKLYGGEKLTLVKSLNDHPKWIQTLKNLVMERQEQKDLSLNILNSLSPSI